MTAGTPLRYESDTCHMKGQNVTATSACSVLRRLISSGPIPVTLRSKALVCGRFTAGIEGSNSAERADVRLLCLLSDG